MEERRGHASAAAAEEGAETSPPGFEGRFESRETAVAAPDRATEEHAGGGESRRRAKGAEPLTDDGRAPGGTPPGSETARRDEAWRSFGAAAPPPPEDALPPLAVHIGRIEVRPASTSAAASRLTPRTQRLSLAAYLRGRRGGR
jgi:hypothetical protein